jgi:hypothetical protein
VRNVFAKLGVTFGAVTILAVLLFLVASASAQVSSGSISGSVVDPTGAAVPGAAVKAVNAGTTQSATTTTDNVGLFKLSLLPVGTYRVEISKPGFRKASLAGLEVAPGVDAGLGNVRLEVGAASETVEVSAGTPLVETTQAQVTNTFETTLLNNLPGIQENQGLDNLALLVPGVSMSRDLGFSNSNGVDFSVNGLRGRNNDQQIDGQNNNDNSVGGPGIFIGDTEFVTEYQITTNNFSAEYGRNAGSVVNIITKSGTNVWHGSVYGTESNSALTTLNNQQAEPAFSPSCPTCWGLGLTKPPRFNDEFTGATIGGPWKKGKIFFFGGFDNEIVSSKNVFGDGTLTPTLAGITQLGGCFPGSASIASLAAYGPYGVGGGGPAPLGATTTKDYGSPGLDPTLVVPVPNDGATGCDVQLAGVQRTLPNGDHQYDWVSRLDVTGSVDNVYVRYIFQKLTFFNATGDGGTGYIGNVPSLGQQIEGSWTHKITNQMLNELRASIGRENVEFGGNALLGNTVPTTANVENALADITFSNTSLLGYGPADNLPQGRIVNTVQLQDNLSYVHGKHQFKAGINYTLQKSPNVFLPNVNGFFQFSDWGTYAANTPNFTSITLGNPKLDFIEHDTFFYVGDDWKATQHLTLNLGLTYTYYGQPANLFHNNDVRQQTGSQPFWLPSLPSSVTEFPEIPAPKTSWGPGIGFAYAVGHGGRLLGENKTVLRGGYRLSYDPPFYNIYLNIASSAPQVLAQTIIPGAALPASPYGPAVRSELASSLQLGVNDPRNFNQTSVTPNFGPDRVHSWSFGIQRELGARAAAEVRYVGNHGENLFQSINGNPYVGCGDGIDPNTGLCFNLFPGSGGVETQLPGLKDAIAAGVFSSSLLPSGVTPCSATSGNAVVPNAVGRENCNLGIERQRTNTSYSAYNGLQAELRTTNLFNQLTLKTNYTWSKTTDNASEIFGTFAGGGTLAFSQNPFNYTNGEHGLSGLDFPQTWAFSFNEAIPAFKGQHGIVGHAFGGWSVSGTYLLQSGQTYTPVEFFSAYALSPYDVSDQAFLGAFSSGSDTARPFLSNPHAPANAIGVYAADACPLFGNPVVCGVAPNPLPAPNALYDYTALNASGGATANPVSASQEHYILNAFEAQTINGTPFGNAGRNSLRDYKTNTGNFQIAKTSNWGERARIIFHMSMVNAFNHPNFSTIDPFLEDAGLVALGTGFANPAVQNGGNRVIRFGIKVTF